MKKSYDQMKAKFKIGSKFFYENQEFKVLTNIFYRPKETDDALIVVGNGKGDMFDFNIEKNCRQNYKD